MNKGISFLFFLIINCRLLTLNSFAQGIQGKMVIGINAAQVDGDAMYGFNRIGPVIGGAANMQLGKKVFLQPEIYYSMRGASSTIYQAYLSTIFHYVDVPIILSFQVGKRWALQGGLSGCYLINALIDGSGYGFGDYTSSFKKYDFCFVTGVEFALSPEWGINARYNYSVLPIGINNPQSRLNVVNWFSNYINVTIRYTFIKRAKDDTKK